MLLCVTVIATVSFKRIVPLILFSFVFLSLFILVFIIERVNLRVNFLGNRFQIYCGRQLSILFDHLEIKTIIFF